MEEETEELNLSETNNVTPEVPVAPRIKNNRRYFKDEFLHTHRTLILSLSILFLVLCGLVIYLAVHENANVPPSVCRSHSCERTAETLLKNMNQSVKPCENFYDFVCGKTDDNSKFLLIYEKIFNLLNKLVVENINDDSPEYLKKLNRFYKTCDCQKNATFDVIKEMSDKIGGWPILNNERSSNETNLDWIEILHKCRKEGLSFNYFLDIHIMLDWKNHSRKVIHLSYPKLGYKKSVLEENFDDFQKNYKQLMKNVSRIMGANDSTEQEFEEMFNFELELAKISPIDEEDEPLKAIRTSVEELDTNYPGIRWLDLLNVILSPYTKVNSSEIVYISHANFFKKFSDLMTNRKPSNRVLTNYAFWRLILDAASHDSCNGLSNYFNLTSSIPLKTKEECTLDVITNMHLATSALYAQSVHANNNTDSAAVKIISENIRKTFYGMIEKVDWLAKGTKNKILEKIHRLDLLIGYPSEFLNDTKLNDYYEDLDIPEDGNYLKNALNFQKFVWQNIDKNYLKPLNKSDWTIGQIIEMPVYMSTNVLKIPITSIDPLFFDQNIPSYVNYGMIGSIVGHEIVHSLSTYGRIYDEQGNRQDANWWDPRSLEIYMNKTKCFVEKYNNYRYPEFQLNGSITLNENMADIEGVRIAYHAYLDTTKTKMDELLLPGFEKYTRNQMFWIASGSNWCEESQRSLESIANSAASSYVHSPGRFRVLGPMSNLPEFASDFNCKPTDVMNPPEKCSMW